MTKLKIVFVNCHLCSLFLNNNILTLSFPSMSLPVQQQILVVSKDKIVEDEKKVEICKSALVS